MYNINLEHFFTKKKKLILLYIVFIVFGEYVKKISNFHRIASFFRVYSVSHYYERFKNRQIIILLLSLLLEYSFKCHLMYLIGTKALYYSCK